MFGEPDPDDPRLPLLARIWILEEGLNLCANDLEYAMNGQTQPTAAERLQRYRKVLAGYTPTFRGWFHHGPTCPKCRDTGWVTQAFDSAERPAGLYACDHA